MQQGHPSYRTGRVIAEKQKRSKSPLRQGEKAAILAVNDAIAKHGDGHPVVRECLEILVAIARGDLSGRYIGDRYRAVIALLDRIDGKPTEKRQHSGTVEHVVRIHRD